MSRPSTAANTLPPTVPFSLPPLLRLPSPVRGRVYRYLRLASWSGRPYKFNLHAGWLKLRHGRGVWDGHDYTAPDPNSFHGLLLSCRTIHAEAATLLYSANKFVFYYFDPLPDPTQMGSLSPLHTLHNLTPLALGSLSDVKIVLNEAACHQLRIHDVQETCCLYGRQEYPDSGKHCCRQKHKDLHQPSLLSPGSGGTEATQAMVAEWHAAAAALLLHAVPGRLALSIVCDIEAKHSQSLNVANSVLTPIRCLPRGYLGECNIRLSNTADRRLQQLAEETVSHASGISTVLPSPLRPSNPAATLLALPRELRIRILRFTDLVAPSREVAWGRKDRAYTAVFMKHDQLAACWFDASWARPPSNGCFCRRRHAAFSKVCKCWAPPGPALFLICRTVYEDAQFVFFSRNRFIVHDYQPFPPSVLPVLDQYPRNYDGPVPAYPYPNKRFAVSQFLRDIVPRLSLAHLRFLELVFPPYLPPSWPGTQHPAMRDWRQTIDWLREQSVNLPGLTIRLIVADPEGHGPAAYHRTITNEEGDTVMTAYKDLFQPLVRLADDGLAAFFASFTHPWAFTAESKRRTMGDLYEEAQFIKERAERYVMGDRYDSLYADGKEEPRPSDWYQIAYSHS